MMERREGNIVMVSSIAGKRGLPANTSYCASKFGLNGMTQALASELGAFGVRVNAVCPGLTDSPRPPTAGATATPSCPPSPSTTARRTSPGSGTSSVRSTAPSCAVWCARGGRRTGALPALRPLRRDDRAGDQRGRGAL
ncbi:SDR family NAD(P)-dependent oxidoreductase [Streptomyces sp. M10(2022)]